MKLLIDETIYEGTALEILEQLRNLTFSPEEFPSADAYLRFLQDNVRRTAGLPCELPEGSTEEKACALFKQLEQLGALERLVA